MSLNSQQFKFTQAVALLINYIYLNGYTASFGCARCTRPGHHKKNSFHEKALAIDINLFKHGVYLDKTEDHEIFGEFWLSIGGTWGGTFKNKDGNHYSWGE